MPYEPVRGENASRQSRTRPRRQGDRASFWNALGYLNFTRAHFRHYDALLERYKDFQICLVDEPTGYPVAIG
ncbi:MAG: hypothetical protein NVV62_18035 [Terricaulis sp.]|nr:hypothetical protein [Terricaulis sp.]